MSRPRSLPPVPRLVGRSPEDYSRELQNFLERLDDYAVITTVSEDDPQTIEAGDAADPGTFQTGWSAGDHVHPVNTSAPVDITLGAVAAEGTSKALARADHVHGTVALEAEIDAKIAAATSNAEDAEYLAWVM